MWGRPNSAIDDKRQNSVLDDIVIPNDWNHNFTFNDVKPEKEDSLEMTQVVSQNDQQARKRDLMEKSCVIRAISIVDMVLISLYFIAELYYMIFWILFWIPGYICGRRLSQRHAYVYCFIQLWAVIVRIISWILVENVFFRIFISLCHIWTLFVFFEVRKFVAQLKTFTEDEIKEIIAMHYGVYDKNIHPAEEEMSVTDRSVKSEVQLTKMKTKIIRKI